MRTEGDREDGEELGEVEAERWPEEEKTGAAASIPSTPLRFLAPGRRTRLGGVGGWLRSALQAV